MQIDAYCSLDFDAPLEREATAQIADGLSDLFDTGPPRERIALIVASDNAGTATSTRFWSEAVRTGVAVASPELFPWCLANAPCGALARHFRITGPNSTLLGESDALLSSLVAALDQIELGRVDIAVVIALSFANRYDAGKALALRLRAGIGAFTLDLEALREPSFPLRAGIDLLRRQLEAG